MQHLMTHTQVLANLRFERPTYPEDDTILPRRRQSEAQAKARALAVQYIDKRKWPVAKERIRSIDGRGGTVVAEETAAIGEGWKNA